MSLHGVDDFLEAALVVGHVHFHLLDAHLAAVIGIGLGVQQNGNHLVGEILL